MDKAASRIRLPFWSVKGVHLQAKRATFEISRYSHRFFCHKYLPF